MKHDSWRWIVALCAAIGGLAALASAAGVFLRGDLTTQTFTTVRGEVVDVLTNGIYRYNGKAIAAEGVGWDAVTLFLVVPALAVCLVGLWRGSLRAALVTTGLLAYFLYQYFEYATFLAYGPLFAVYVLIAALSLAGIVALVGRIDLAELAERMATGFPRRGAIGLGLWMVVLLCGLWLPLIVSTWNQAVVPELDGATTLVVQAFDLGVLVPLGLFTAFAVWRRLPVGYLLASVVVVKAVAMPTAIVAMLVIEALATGELKAAPIGIFALTAAVSAAIGWRVYARMTPAGEAPDAPVRGAAPVPGQIPVQRRQGRRTTPEPAALSVESGVGDPKGLDSPA